MTVRGMRLGGDSASMVRPLQRAAVLLALGLVGSAAAQDLFVTSGNRVYRFDGMTGGSLGVFAEDPALSARGLVFGPDGNLYVANFNQNSVHRFDAQTGAPRPCGGCAGALFVPSQSGGLTQPHGIAFRSNGELIVASIGASSGVKRYSATTGAFLGAFTTGPGQFPRGMTFGPTGEFFVTSDNNVLRYPPSGGSSPTVFATHAAGGNTHYDLTFGPDGHLYLSSFFTHKVRRYHGVTGAFIDDFVPAGGGGLVQPVGLRFGPDGNLYVCSSGTNQILRYDGVTGAFLGVFASGIGAPQYLAFSPFVDCNGNGSSDADDIAAGNSPDANANGVPDECEPGAQIDGPLMAQFMTPQGLRQMVVPDIEVFPRNAATLADGDHVLTDINGRFEIPHTLSGAYRVCWSGPGYVDGCSAEVITLGTQGVFTRLQVVQPRPNVVHGRVLLANGRPAMFRDEAFGVNLETHVFLLDGSGATLAALRTNSAGQFLIPDVPSGSYTLLATAELASVSQPFNVAGGPVELNLEFPNSPPAIRSVYANVRTASLGQTVTVTADAGDPDGDPLTYTWLAQVAGAPFTSSNSPNVSWTLPSVSGRHSIYVLVSDSLGGYALGLLRLPTTNTGIPMRGTITGLDAAPVAAAEVTINGQTTLTDGAGFFSIQTADADRFVMTVRAPGFQTVSRVLTQPASEFQIPLVEVAPTSIDPTRAVRVTEPGPYSPDDVADFLQCLDGVGQTPTAPPPGSTQGCLTAYDFADDGDVDLADVLEFQTRFAPANRASVQFAANSLRNGAGQLPSGPLNVSLSRIDLSDSFGRLPGDYGAINSAMQDVTLVSYGAIEIEIRDGASQLYNLAPGATATITIPVQALGATPPPTTIPIWYYDEADGVWIEDGVATLEDGVYVATVSHFSVINADVEFTNPSCLELAFNPPRCTPFMLKVSIPAVSPTLVFTQLIQDPSQKSVLYRLPVNTNIKLEILDVHGNPAVGAVAQVFNTGAAVAGNGNNPVYPYTGCHPITVQLPFTAPPDNGFLDHVGLDAQADSDAYYATIDPTSSKTTLAAWKTANGFNAGDDASASYFNGLDLGFGRGMHLKKVGNRVAYYVTNFLNVEEAILGTLPIATVAMEYSQVGGSGPLFTQFYVFDSTGARTGAADLDGGGLKYIPRLCIICHAGQAGTVSGLTYSNNGDVSAKFIPFPIDSFAYSPSLSSGTLEPAMKTLNARVLDTGPTPAITELVQGWYGGPTLPNGTQNPLFVPTGWSTKASLYLDVIRPSCRICHATRTGSIDWSKWSDTTNWAFKEWGGTINYHIRTSRKMPNAKCTYEQFWSSDQCNKLRTAGLDNWPLTDTCP